MTSVQRLLPPKIPTQDDVKENDRAVAGRQFPQMSCISACLGNRGSLCPAFSLQGCLFSQHPGRQGWCVSWGQRAGLFTVWCYKVTLRAEMRQVCLRPFITDLGSLKSGCLQRIEQAVCPWTAPFSCLGLEEQQKPGQTWNSAACCSEWQSPLSLNWMSYILRQHLWNCRLNISGPSSFSCYVPASALSTWNTQYWIKCSNIPELMELRLYCKKDI